MQCRGNKGRLDRLLSAAAFKSKREKERELGSRKALEFKYTNTNRARFFIGGLLTVQLQK